MVLRMADKYERAAYLNLVESLRGIEGVERLKEAVRREWNERLATRTTTTRANP